MSFEHRRPVESAAPAGRSLCSSIASGSKASAKRRLFQGKGSISVPAKHTERRMMQKLKRHGLFMSNNESAYRHTFNSVTFKIINSI